MMIVGFPSTMQLFEITQVVSRCDEINYSHYIGRHIEIKAPIDLKPLDQVWVDLRTSQLHAVLRDGFAVWRAGWQN